MPNWTYVSAYSAATRDWLAGFGLRCPEVVVGNRPPAVGEILAACERLRGLPDHHSIAVDCYDPGFDWNDPGAVATTLVAHGDWLGHWHLLLALAEHCGQLFYWPPAGAPGLIIERGMDPRVIDEVYREAVGRQDDWEDAFRALYQA